MSTGEAARTALLASAERLFALEGIDVVSDRRIAQEAGQANHSAVRYHFGGRDGLLDALFARHLGDLEPHRRELLAASEDLMGDVRALIGPNIRASAQAGTPSWRARFIQVAMATPATRARVTAASDEAPSAVDAYRSIVHRLAHLDPVIVRARTQVMMHIAFTTFAEIEARKEASGVADWDAAEGFLLDAICGMLQAPITQR